LLFNTQRDQTLTVDASRPRNCPRCQGIQLKRVLLNPGSEVQIDECPSCDGCWLDERQLGRLHDERVEMIQSGRIQPGTSFNLLQYLFEVRTGRRR
jgi:Zn-finger nucleic acid-binding protein